MYVYIYTYIYYTMYLYYLKYMHFESIVERLGKAGKGQNDIFGRQRLEGCKRKCPGTRTPAILLSRSR